MKKIVLIDFFDSGHHLSYIETYSSAFINMGCRVTIISPYDFTKKFKEVESIVSLELAKLASERSLLSGLRVWLSLSAILKHHPSDVPAFFLYNNTSNFFKIPYWLIDIFFRRPWSLICMQPEGVNTTRSLVKKLVVSLLGMKVSPESYLFSRRLKRVYFLDESILDKYLTHYSSLKEKLSWLPDVTNTDLCVSDIASRIVSKANGRKIISLVGTLQQRKGVLGFIRLALASSDEYYFVFCGKPYWTSFNDDGVFFKNFINSNPSNCFFYLEHIEDERDLNAVIQVSSVVYSVMEGYDTSSNILTKAALLNKPVLVSDKGVCAARTIKYGLGAVVSVGDTYSALKSIERLSKIDNYKANTEFTEKYRTDSLKEVIRNDFIGTAKKLVL